MIQGFIKLGKDEQSYCQDLYKTKGVDIFSDAIDISGEGIISYINRHREDEDWYEWAQTQCEYDIEQELQRNDDMNNIIISENEYGKETNVKTFKLRREGKGWRWINKDEFDVISGVVETNCKTAFSRAVYSGDYKEAALLERQRQLSRDKIEYVQGTEKVKNVGGVWIKGSKKKSSEVTIDTGSGITFSALKKNNSINPSGDFTLSPNGIRIYNDPKKHPYVMNRKFIVDRNNPGRLDVHYNDILEWVDIRDHYHPHIGNYCGHSESDLINIVIEYCRRFNYFDWCDNNALDDCLHTLKGKICSLYEDMLDELDRIGYLDFSDIPFDINVANPVLQMFRNRRSELRSEIV